MELLVVIGIIAVLIGLLLPAIQKVREAAIRAKSENNLHGIIIAIHCYSTISNGKLPSIDGGDGVPREALFVTLLPYVEQDNTYRKLLEPAPTDDKNVGVMIYISPADPTINKDIFPYGMCSYPANAQVFCGNHNIASWVSDGLSNTIGFAEHYGGNCEGQLFHYFVEDTVFVRRATFADGNLPIPSLDDVYPVTSGNPPTSIGNDAAKTFQIAPRLDQCDSTVAQTPHRSGMLVALMDGGVRALSPSISKEVYWGAVTPHSGEVLAMEW
jgi:type II secretory pathway pseudopilin PulG